jgi:hypothetical protein
VIPIVLSIFPSGKELNILIQQYFNSPDSIQTNILLFREKSTNEIGGFSVYYFFKHHFPNNSHSKENTFLMTTLFGCLKDTNRRSGLRKEYFKIKGISDLIDYPHSNLVHFDVSINLISYYGVCQVSNCVFPNYSRQVPEQVKEFLVGLAEKFEYSRYGHDPFVVNDSFEDSKFDREYWMKNYKTMPNDVKFFIDKTNLEKNVGLAYVSVYNLIENNSLGLPAGVNLIEEKPRIPVYSYTFNLPRL